jgi:hypothetical protein
MHPEVTEQPAMILTAWRPLFLATLATVLAACGPGGGEGGRTDAEPAREITQRSFSEFGDYVVHYNAQATEMLPPEVARAYGIQRSANRAMITVSVVRKQEGTIGQTVAADVTVNASNLTGQLKSVETREIRESEAIYYIGELGVANRETLIFDISVRPEGEKSSFQVKFRQQFYTS